MRAKHWIANAVRAKGSLRAELHTPKGKNIPKGKLAKAAKAKGKLGKRARLAETLEKMHRK